MLYSKKELIYLDPGHTAKTLVLVYLCFSVPIVLLGLTVAYFREGNLPGLAIFTALVLNALIGYALLWIACKVYNEVAKRFGGIELALKDSPLPPLKIDD